MIENLLVTYQTLSSRTLTCLNLNCSLLARLTLPKACSWECWNKECSADLQSRRIMENDDTIKRVLQLSADSKIWIQISILPLAASIAASRSLPAGLPAGLSLWTAPKVTHILSRPKVYISSCSAIWQSRFKKAIPSRCKWTNQGWTSSTSSARTWASPDNCSLPWFEKTIY